jgi:hypothetical protein
MVRWILISLAVLANCLAVLVAVAPAYVTLVPIMPPTIECSACTIPETQRALFQAIEFGQAQIAGFIKSNLWLIVALACLNVLALVAALFVPALTRRSAGRAEERRAPAS